MLIVLACLLPLTQFEELVLPIVAPAPTISDMGWGWGHCPHKVGDDSSRFATYFPCVLFTHLVTMIVSSTNHESYFCTLTALARFI